MRGSPSRRAALVVAVLGLAWLSLLRPSAPTTDPWGWILWGRELLHLDLNTNTALSPSWKPLPVLLTTPLGLLGGAAPDAWLVLARAAGLGALVAVFALGRRVGGVVAGSVAALSLALSGGWLHALEHGYSEPLMILLLVTALARHLDGKRLQAMGLATLVGLGRPEIWPLLLLYAAVVWQTRPQRRVAVAVLLVSVPALWFGGDWWGSGDPFHGRNVAEHASGGGSPVDMLAAVADFAGLPVLALAALGWLIGGRRDVRVAALGALGCGWIGLVIAMVALGYPGSERFVALPCSLLCVVAGVGAASMTTGRATLPPRMRVAAAALLAVLAGWYLPGRLEPLGSQLRAGERRALVQASLRTLARQHSIVARAGCGVALPPRLMWNAGALAWDLHLPLRRAQGIAWPIGTTPATTAFVRVPARGRGRGWIALPECASR